MKPLEPIGKCILELYKEKFPSVLETAPCKKENFYVNEINKRAVAAWNKAIDENLVNYNNVSDLAAFQLQFRDVEDFYTNKYAAPPKDKKDPDYAPEIGPLYELKILRVRVRG